MTTATGNRKLNPIARRIVPSTHGMSSQLLLRLNFIIITYAAGIVVTLLLLFYNIQARDSSLIVADVFLIGCICGWMLIIHYFEAYRLAFQGSVAVFAILTWGVYLSGEVERATVLTPIVLVLAFFLLGSKAGARWTVLVLFANAVLHLYMLQTSDNFYMTTADLITNGIIVSFIAVMLYVFGSSYERSQALVERQDLALTTSNTRLKDELAKNIELTQKMQYAIDNTEKNNTVLEQSKKALMNVLEDSNELQAQLTQEKEGVEEKIKERTQQLQEEQARLHASIDTLDLGFLMTLPDGNSIMHNPALITITGVKAHKRTVTPADLLHTLAHQIGDSFDLEDAVKKCQDTAKPFTADEVRLHEKSIRILGSAIRSSAYSEPLGVVILIQDISAEKDLERSKDEFISIASHELRTPLTAIRGNISLLQMLHGESFQDAEVKEMMDDINDSVIRLISIVNQFLTTSRLEQKKTVFQFTAVNTENVIERVAGELKPMADEAKLSLTLMIPNNIPTVKADESRLQGVLNNLIGNAIKYTPKGGITVSAELVNSQVVIRVSDTGKGMDPANQKLLFRKFQQASDNILTRDDSRSTGLGLYITKLMVDQMGGVIELESSAVGKGSVFRLTLPVA